LDILLCINFLFINTFNLLITVPYYKQYFDKQPRTCIFVYLSNNFLRINSQLWNYMIKRVHICGTRVAQSVGWLTFDFPSDHDLRSVVISGHEIQPCLRLPAQKESAWDSLSPSVCPSLLLVRTHIHTLSLFLSFSKQTNKIFLKVHILFYFLRGALF